MKDEIFLYLKGLGENEVITYGALARMFKTSPRAVGKILSGNRDKKIPCYKVIKSDGDLGGYNNLIGKDKCELLRDVVVVFN